MIAMTGTGGVILGPMQDSAEGGIEHGWDKTAKNPAIFAAMAGVSYLIQNIFGL